MVLQNCKNIQETDGHPGLGGHKANRAMKSIIIVLVGDFDNIDHPIP
jgi:hypothetical protein